MTSCGTIDGTRVSVSKDLSRDSDSKRLIVNKVIMVLTVYAKQRILQLHWEGNTPPAIEQLLKKDEGIKISRVSIWKFLRKF